MELVKRENLYRRTLLENINIGDTFLHNGVEFEKIYDKHAIMVGLTVEEHDGSRRIGQFADDTLVLVKLKPIDEE